MILEIRQHFHKIDMKLKIAEKTRRKLQRHIKGQEINAEMARF
jgi:hypothetical protein